MSLNGKHILVVVFILVIYFVPQIAIAQYPTDPGGGTDPDNVPISGIEILLAIGGGLGIKRFLGLRKNKT